MKIEKDGSGNSYVKVSNVRITYVPVSTRDNKSNWSGGDCLRIQAHRDSTETTLHMGAEIDLGRLGGAIPMQILSAIIHLMDDAKR